jgi:hypothetical protein
MNNQEREPQYVCVVCSCVHECKADCARCVFMCACMKPRNENEPMLPPCIHVCMHEQPEMRTKVCVCRAFMRACMQITHKYARVKHSGQRCRLAILARHMLCVCMYENHTKYACVKHSEGSRLATSVV